MTLIRAAGKRLIGKLHGPVFPSLILLSSVLVSSILLSSINTLSAQAISGLAPQTSFSASAKHAIAIRRAAEGIPNFAEVNPKLYRGGQPNREGMKALKKLGIGVVVDMRGSRNKNEAAAVNEMGMEYFSIPSHCPFPTDKPYARFLTIVQENPGKKVFVHCRLGDDRTGMAVAAYRMADEGWSADEALEEMKIFGFSGIHHLICPGLSHYAKSFPKRLKTKPAFQDLKPPRAADAAK